MKAKNAEAQKRFDAQNQTAYVPIFVVCVGSFFAVVV